jgi:hypothetical protein
MAIPALAWWIGGGVLGLVGVGVTAEVIHKRNVAKALAANQKTTAGIAAAATPAASPAAQQAAASAPAQAGLAAGAAAAGATPQQVQAAAAALGGNFQDILAAQIAANPGVDPATVAAATAKSVLDSAASLQTTGTAVNPATVQQARVQTNDPAPLGDLIIRSGPSLSSPQIGGAEKGGLVTVLDSGQVQGDFTHVDWAGGSRLPAAQGFAHTSALQLI